MITKAFFSITNRQNRQILSTIACSFLSLGLLTSAQAQSAVNSPASPLQPFGKTFAQSGQVVEQQTRIIFYRTPQSSNVPGAASIYINGAYHASLIPGGYSELCMRPGKTELGVKSVEVGRNVKDTLDSMTVVNSASAQSQYVRVKAMGADRQILQPVKTEEALKEIEGTREQTHTITRVPEAVECTTSSTSAATATPIAAPAAIPAKPASAKTITLAADALFAFSRSDLASMSPTGRSSLDKLATQLRSEYIQLEHLHIVGHADPLGQSGPNERLSIERANTVRQYLSQAGLDNVRMSSEGRGDREPVVTQCARVTTPASIACNAPNRRVDLHITGARR